MKYEVMVTFGDGAKEYITVENVKEITGTEKYLIIYNKEGEIALSVPREKLVYCYRVN